MQILLTIHEVVRNQKNLRRHQPHGGKFGVVHLHEPTLTHGRQGLQRANLGGSLGESHGRHTGGHGTRRHENDFVAIGPQSRDLTTQVRYDDAIDHAQRIGER